MYNNFGDIMSLLEQYLANVPWDPFKESYSRQLPYQPSTDPRIEQRLSPWRWRTNQPRFEQPHQPWSPSPQPKPRPSMPSQGLGLQPIDPRIEQRLSPWRGRINQPRINQPWRLPAPSTNKSQEASNDGGMRYF